MITDQFGGVALSQEQKERLDREFSIARMLREKTLKNKDRNVIPFCLKELVEMIAMKAFDAKIVQEKDYQLTAGALRSLLLLNSRAMDIDIEFSVFPVQEGDIKATLKKIAAIVVSTIGEMQGKDIPFNEQDLERRYVYNKIAFAYTDAGDQVQKCAGFLVSLDRLDLKFMCRSMPWRGYVSTDERLHLNCNTHIIHCYDGHTICNRQEINKTLKELFCYKLNIPDPEKVERDLIMRLSLDACRGKGPIDSSILQIALKQFIQATNELDKPYDKLKFSDKYHLFLNNHYGENRIAAILNRICFLSFLNKIEDSTLRKVYLQTFAETWLMKDDAFHTLPTLVKRHPELAEPILTLIEGFCLLAWMQGDANIVLYDFSYMEEMRLQIAIKHLYMDDTEPEDCQQSLANYLHSNIYTHYLPIKRFPVELAIETLKSWEKINKELGEEVINQLLNECSFIALKKLSFWEMALEFMKHIEQENVKKTIRSNSQKRSTHLLKAIYVFIEKEKGDKDALALAWIKAYQKYAPANEFSLELHQRLCKIILWEDPSEELQKHLRAVIKDLEDFSKKTILALTMNCEPSSLLKIGKIAWSVMQCGIGNVNMLPLAQQLLHSKDAASSQLGEELLLNALLLAMQTNDPELTFAVVQNLNVCWNNRITEMPFWSQFGFRLFDHLVNLCEKPPNQMHVEAYATFADAILQMISANNKSVYYNDNSLNLDNSYLDFYNDYLIKILKSSEKAENFLLACSIFRNNATSSWKCGLEIFERGCDFAEKQHSADIIQGICKVMLHVFKAHDPDFNEKQTLLFLNLFENYYNTFYAEHDSYLNDLFYHFLKSFLEKKGKEHALNEQVKRRFISQAMEDKFYECFQTIMNCQNKKTKDVTIFLILALNRFAGIFFSVNCYKGFKKILATPLQRFSSKLQKADLSNIENVIVYLDQLHRSEVFELYAQCDPKNGYTILIVLQNAIVHHARSMYYQNLALSPAADRFFVCYKKWLPIVTRGFALPPIHLYQQHLNKKTFCENIIPMREQQILYEMHYLYFLHFREKTELEKERLKNFEELLVDHLENSNPYNFLGLLRHVELGYVSGILTGVDKYPCFINFFKLFFKGCSNAIYMDSIQYAYYFVIEDILFSSLLIKSIEEVMNVKDSSIPVSQYKKKLAQRSEPFINCFTENCKKNGRKIIFNTWSGGWSVSLFLRSKSR